MPDLRRLRQELGYFAEQVGEPLADWQIEDLRCEAPITCLLWGRQLGKSRALALRALWRAYGAPERRVLVVSGGGDLGARRLLGEVRRIAAGSELLRSAIVDEAASVLRLSTGSEVRCVAASESAIRGWAADELAVDEAQLVPADLLLGSALPVTTAREGARAVLAGTASAASGAFFDLCRQGEVGAEHVRFSRRVSRLVGGPDAAPWQQASMIEAQLAAMGRLRADAEHRCVFASGADLLFSRASIERVVADYAAPPLSELRGPARMTLGIDFGAVHDRSAAVAIGRLAGSEVFGVACAHRWEAGHPLHRVVEEIVEAPAHYQAVFAERNGMGEALAGREGLLWRRLADRPAVSGGGRRPPRYVVIEEQPGRPDLYGSRVRQPAPPVRAPAGFRTHMVGVTTTAPLKSAVFQELRMLVDTERLVLPASAGTLLGELLTLRVSLTEAGEERIESGGSDLAMALAFAAGPYPDRRRGGRLRCYLADLADPRRRLPGPALDLRNVDMPTVDTGGGLAVPRRPVWQSIYGSELSLPPGVEGPPRPPPGAGPYRIQDIRELRPAPFVNYE